MVVLDASNNRVISDGSTVFLGDQILIDLKTKKRGSFLSLFFSFNSADFFSLFLQDLKRL
jgi:hypothetical protein